MDIICFARRTPHLPERPGAEGLALMRLCILAGSVAFLFAVESPPARGADDAVQTRSAAGGDEQPPGTEADAGPAVWLWGLVRDRLTIPLGQAERMAWPSGGA
jgi:hypothetical protein